MDTLVAICFTVGIVLSVCIIGPHTLQVTILLLVAALQYVLLFHDPFYVYPSVSERILHIVDDHRLVMML